MKIIEELHEYLDGLCKTIEDQSYIMTEMQDKIDALHDENDKLAEKTEKLKELVDRKPGTQKAQTRLGMIIQNLEIGASHFEPGDDATKRLSSFAHRASNSAKTFAVRRVFEDDKLVGGRVHRIE